MSATLPLSQKPSSPREIYRYAHGFAALKSLDASNDNAFTSADAAWSNVKVWVDANQYGQTEAGELKSLNELGISRINLAPTLQSGLVNGGNEVLATGTFVMGGQTRAAQAVRFIAEATGETIDVALKGVRNAYGGSGNDTLIGDAHANWLAGGQGAEFDRHLRYPVADRRYPQRAHAAVRLGDQHAPHRLGTVGLCLQFTGQLPQEAFCRHRSAVRGSVRAGPHSSVA